MAPVSGTVKYNGQPVEGASVTFRVEGAPRVASGMTNAAGEYRLTTYDTDDGAPVGEHSVTITKADASQLPPAPTAAPTGLAGGDYLKSVEGRAGGSTAPPSVEPPKGGAGVPAKYSDPAQSGLKRTVVKGEANVFNFDLTD
jgi:hypothetical protein